MLANKGQSLIEALVALGAASIILAGIAIAVISSVNNSDYSVKQNQASGYAQEELEKLYQQSRTDWATFSKYSTVTNYYCPDSNGDLPSSPDSTFNSCDPNLGLINVDGVDQYIYRRTVQIAQKSADCPGPSPANLTFNAGTKVTVVVSWTDGKCTAQNDKYCHSAKVNSCFTNIDLSLTPTP